mgnify:CR=1 FL=1
MELAFSSFSNFHIVSMSGQISSLKDSILLKSEINSLVEEKKTRIALELKHMEYVDSAALNVFIYAKNTIEKSGGFFCILEPNEYILNMLSVVGLLNVFTICDSRDALKSIAN